MAKLTNTNTTATAETATTATTATAPKTAPKSTPKKTNTTKAPKTDRKKTDTKTDTPKKTPTKTNNAPTKTDTEHDNAILAEIVADCTALAKYSKSKHFTDKYIVSVDIPDSIGEKSKQYISEKLKNRFKLFPTHLYTPLAYLTLEDGDDYILMSHKAPEDGISRVTIYDVNEWLKNKTADITVPAEKSDSGRKETHRIPMTFELKKA